MMSMASAPRAGEIEIMDAGGYDEPEIRGNLADLRFYNRWFGGSRLVAREVASLVSAGVAESPPAAGQSSRRKLTVMDVATGSGDIPVYLARWAEGRGIELLSE